MRPVRPRQSFNYVGPDGGIPFAKWLMGLDAVTRARIDKRINKLRTGNFGDYKAVGEGVVELREHHGPGYRIYVGQDGDTLVILLGGGSKNGQQVDIAQAIERWREYRLQPDDAEPPRAAKGPHKASC